MIPLKPYLLLFFSIFLASSTLAQKTSLYTFDVTDSIVGHSSFAAVKVVDNRNRRKDLGYVTRLANVVPERLALTTEKPLATELSILGEKLLTKAERGEDTLLFVLHDFYTKMDNEEYPMFYIRAVCFLGKDDHYRFIRELDIMLMDRDRNSSIHDVLWRPNFAIVDCFKAIAEVNAEQLPTGQYSEQQAARYFNTQRDSLPAYMPHNFKKGIYRTYEDFLYQKVLDTPFTKFDSFVHDVNSPFFYYKTAKGRKGEQVENVFAIYDGKYWYLPRKDGATKLKFTGGDYYTVVHAYYITHRLHPLTSELMPVLLYAP